MSGFCAKWGNGYREVRKDVRLLEKSEEMGIVRVPKDVSLLGKMLH